MLDSVLGPIMHILREYPAMSGIWQRLVPIGKAQRFFTQSLLEWLYENLSREVQMEHYPWSTLFGMSVWWGYGNGGVGTFLE